MYEIRLLLCPCPCRACTCFIFDLLLTLSDCVVLSVLPDCSWSPVSNKARPLFSQLTPNMFNTSENPSETIIIYFLSWSFFIGLKKLRQLWVCKFRFPWQRQGSLFGSVEEQDKFEGHSWCAEIRHPVAAARSYRTARQPWSTWASSRRRSRRPSGQCWRGMPAWRKPRSRECSEFSQ